VRKNKNYDKYKQAPNLPTLCNINPRSLYNKKTEFCTFIEQENIDKAFISETWERKTKLLMILLTLKIFILLQMFLKEMVVGATCNRHQSRKIYNKRAYKHHNTRTMGGRSCMGIAHTQKCFT